MRPVIGLGLVAALIVPTLAVAQSTSRQSPPARKPAQPSKPAPKVAAKSAPSPAAKREPAKVTCPATLGTGVKTDRVFCDVLTGRDPADGVIVTIPPHAGAATLTFDLHNRHTYSEEQVKARRAYAEYLATIGVLTMTGELLTRAVVYSSFRTADDLVDRIGGGAGPSGVKAVAPTGTESIVVSIPQDVTEVSLLGERLVTRRLDGEEVATSPGRPIAVVSNVMVEYRPAPARRPVTRR